MRPDARAPYPWPMSPFVKLLLLVLVLAVVWYVVTRVRNTQQQPVSFQPVSQLPTEQRAAVEAAIANDQLVTAIKIYREATGAGLAASKAAVDTHRGKPRG